MKIDKISLPAYLISALLITFPLLDSVTQVWPFAPTATQWRFGALGLFSRALMTPLLGLLVMFAASLIAEHQGVQRAVGVLAWLATGTCLALSGIFALDALSMQELVEEQARQAFGASSFLALLKYGLVAVASAALGIAGISSSRSARRRQERQSEGTQMVFGGGAADG